MNKHTYLYFILMASLSLTVSCLREELQEPEVCANVHGGEVTVKLTIDVGKEQAGTPDALDYINRVDTKAVDDPAVATTTAIKDFYLLQFNGTADTCQMIGTAHYYDYQEFISPSNPDGANTLRLVASTAPDAIFILANTCQGNAADKDKLVFPQGMTIADLKSRVKNISSQADLFGNGVAGAGSSFPDDRTYHIMLNAQVNETISAGTTLNISLKRNIARIKVVINNTTATTDPSNPVTIKTLSLHNVPAVSAYITNTVNAQPLYYPSSEQVQTFNYPDEPYNASGNTFYVPVNKRGANSNSTQNTKGVMAPASSTYLRVDAEYTTGGVTVPITYTFYLGANLINDYNILPNSTYTYNITMSKKGDENYDYRVEDWGPVDFTGPTVERANCYILNPALTYSRQFKIPIDRIRTFWGGEGKTDTKGYEKYLSSTDPNTFMNQTFSAFILWTDIEDLTGIDGTYNTDDDKVKVDMTVNRGNNACFTVTVKPGTEGNAVVAVTGSAVSNEILWSWHLWITDYRPDEIKRYASKENGRYIYEVTGGAMHRYADQSGTDTPAWEGNGKYVDKFIMDRNLGALDTVFVSNKGGKGKLYYQFGRKDPLPGPKNDTAKVYYYYPKPDLDAGLKWKAVSSTDAGAAFTNADAIRYAIRYPLAFIKGKSGEGAWTSGNKYVPSGSGNSAITWQDPNVSGDIGKSIFDPCPPGYKVPNPYFWNDFNAYDVSTNPKPTTNVRGGGNPPRGFPLLGNVVRGGKSQKGMHYYPGTDDVTKTIFYPVTPEIQINGEYADGDRTGSYWTCGASNTPNSARGVAYNNTTIFLGQATSRARGQAVRCIQE